MLALALMSQLSLEHFHGVMGNNCKTYKVAGVAGQQLAWNVAGQHSTVRQDETDWLIEQHGGVVSVYLQILHGICAQTKQLRFHCWFGAIAVLCLGLSL